jgi:mRNA deadenylase 3'-5' endonuclease subunit Ccr4
MAIKGVLFGDGARMKLYHGSNSEVKEPKLLPDVRALDFGAGFYLTSSIEQAKRWAKSVTKRRNTGHPVLSVFEIEETELALLSILQFDSANAEWLKFISANRNNQPFDQLTAKNWDVVIGPVANDNTMPILQFYLKGNYNEEEALNRRLTQKLKVQYAFKTDVAIALI